MAQGFPLVATPPISPVRGRRGHENEILQEHGVLSRDRERRLPLIGTVILLVVADLDRRYRSTSLW